MPSLTASVANLGFQLNSRAADGSYLDLSKIDLGDGHGYRTEDSFPRIATGGTPVVIGFTALGRCGVGNDGRLERRRICARPGWLLAHEHDGQCRDAVGACDRRFAPRRADHGCLGLRGRGRVILRGRDRHDRRRWLLRLGRVVRARDAEASSQRRRSVDKTEAISGSRWSLSNVATRGRHRRRLHRFIRGHGERGNQCHRQPLHLAARLAHRVRGNADLADPRRNDGAGGQRHGDGRRRRLRLGGRFVPACRHDGNRWLDGDRGLALGRSDLRRNRRQLQRRLSRARDRSSFSGSATEIDLGIDVVVISRDYATRRARGARPQRLRRGRPGHVGGPEPRCTGRWRPVRLGAHLVARRVCRPSR